MNASDAFKCLLLSACLLLPAGELLGGAPLKINFQGRLSENGQPAEGAKTFLFKIYGVSSGGSPVWTGASQALTLSQGVFSAELSAGTPALSTATFSGTRYVEITVDGVTLSPRQEMVSAPYALVAQALAADADIPPAAIAPGSVTDSHVTLTTAAITSGRFSDDRVLVTTGAFAALNGADQLVKLDGSGNLPALNGSALTNVAAASYSGAVAVSQLTGVINDNRLAISTGAFPGGFNAADKLVKLDGSGNLPALNGSALTNVTAANYSGGVAASQLTSVLNDSSLAISTGAFPGGFNAANKLVQLDGSGNLPVLNGSALTNVAAASYSGAVAASQLTGVINDNRLAISSGAFTNGFNEANELLQLDGSALIPVASVPGLPAAKITSGKFYDAQLAVSTGAFPGGFNAADQLVRLDGSGRLGVGGAANSALTVAGSLSLPIRTINSSGMVLNAGSGRYECSVSAADHTVIVDGTGVGADIDVILPTAVGIAGRVYVIKRIDAEALTMNYLPQTGEQVDDGTPIALTQWDSFTFQSNGTQWYILTR